MTDPRTSLPALAVATGGLALVVTAVLSLTSWRTDLSSAAAPAEKPSKYHLVLERGNDGIARYVPCDRPRPTPSAPGRDT